MSSVIDETEKLPTIYKIATHPNPHFDEIVAIFLIRKYGHKKYRGIDSAKIIFMNSDSGNAVTKNTVKDYEKEGTLAIGIGNGRFDEHKQGSGVKESECAATLVANYLGISKNPELTQLLKYALNNDRKGASSPFDLASIIKSLYQNYPDDPMFVINWAMTALESKLMEQKKFFDQSADHYAKAKKLNFSFLNRNYLLVVADSDEPQFNKYARWRGAAIVIQRNSKGNVQIFTNKKLANFRMKDVIRILRIKEQKKSSTPNPITDWKVLATEGSCANWYYQQETETILNGSLTNPNIEPTKLDLKTIISAVITGVNPASFPKNCPVNKCISKQCSWYHLGLSRCSAKRFKQKNK